MYFYTDTQPVANIWLGYDHMESYFSGGETYTSADNMGTSNNYYVQYWRGGQWYLPPQNALSRLVTNPRYDAAFINAPASWLVWTY